MRNDRPEDKKHKEIIIPANVTIRLKGILHARDLYSEAGLVETLRRYNNSFGLEDLGEDGEVAYSYFDSSGEPYLIYAADVSNSIQDHPPIFSVASESKERNSQILEEFQERTGCELKPCSESTNIFIQQGLGPLIMATFYERLGEFRRSQEDPE